MVVEPMARKKNILTINNIRVAVCLLGLDEKH